MDSLTHLVLGAAIGEALLGKQLGKKAMLWGALADTIPDLDVFFVPLFKGPDSLLVHRGISHSILFALVVSPLLGKWFSTFQFKRQTSFRNWTLLFLAGLLTHIGLDSLTAYGTGWFEPFSHARVTFNCIFVADPFYTMPFLICVIALLFLRTDSPKRKKWNRAGLVISTAYLVFTIVNKAWLNTYFRASLDQEHVTYSRSFSTPTALNNFLWMNVAETDSGYFVGYLSDFDSDKNVQYHFIPRNERFLTEKVDAADLARLKWFSNGYYCITQTDTSILFNDLRFGQMSGWSDPDSPFAFSYDLVNTNGPRALNRGRFKGSVKDVFYGLIRRIRGN